MRITHNKKRIVGFGVCLLLGVMSFMGFVYASMVLGGDGSVPQPTHLQSIVGGVTLIIASLSFAVEW